MSTPRPIAVAVAARALWATAAALAVAAAVRTIGLGPASEAMREAHVDTAHAHGLDPDVLSMTPFLVGVAGLFAVLAYACSAFFFALAARSVGRGGRASFALAVFTWGASVLCCGVQPFTWYRLYTGGGAIDRSMLERAAEDLPWWLVAVELTALALLALSTVAVGLLLRSDARAFRRPAPVPPTPTTAWKFGDRPPRYARERSSAGERPRG